MLADVEERNSELSRVYEQIDGLLAATLEVDDYVDLDELRATVEHPPFSRRDLEVPIPIPESETLPLEPVYSDPPPPTGVRAIFGKRKYEAAISKAELLHRRRTESWQEKTARILSKNQLALDRHKADEETRRAALQDAKERHQNECQKRESEADAQNKSIDLLIANLGYGVKEAVEEYLSIVLSNSVYPPEFMVTHKSTFDVPTAELGLRVLVPGPSELPTEKVFKYVKAADEIRATQHSQKTRKDRYAGAVHQVALRSLHEIFEADRRGIIKSISLEVGTNALDTGTGLEKHVSLVGVAADRESFLLINLEHVTPRDTLDYLGAAVSKDPFGLKPVDVSGIRRS
ncbi:MAG: hypothetical protein V3W41_22800 [Planctomycetota bacterium]